MRAFTRMLLLVLIAMVGAMLYIQTDFLHSHGRVSGDEFNPIIHGRRDAADVYRKKHKTVRGEIVEHTAEKHIEDAAGLLSALKKEEVQKVLADSLHAVKTIDGKNMVVPIDPPSHPVIVMFWPTEPGGGWYPWDHPNTFNALIDKRTCRVEGCTYIDDTATPDELYAADAVVFHVPSVQVWGNHNVDLFLNKSGGRPKRPGQSWWYFTQESVHNYPVPESFYSNMDFDISYELSSHVPITYASRIWDYDFWYYNETKRNDALAIFISSNCSPRNARKEWISGLMEIIPVHSYGGCLKNANFTDPDTGDTYHAAHGDWGFDAKKKLRVQGQYKYCLTFDNRDTPDYISEKLFQGLTAGCLPVYMGAPNVDDFIPTPESVIKTADFKNPQELGKYLLKLADDQEEYDRRLSWKKTRGGESKMLYLQSQSVVTAPCRLCEFIAGKEGKPRTEEEEREFYDIATEYIVNDNPFRGYMDRERKEGEKKGERKP